MGLLKILKKLFKKVGSSSIKNLPKKGTDREIKTANPRSFFENLKRSFSRKKDKSGIKTKAKNQEKWAPIPKISQY